MGAGASTTVDTRQQYVSSVIQQCPTSKCSNIVGDINITADSGDVTGTKITQQCEVDTDCVFKAVANSIAEQETKAAAETAAGLGIAVSNVNIRSAQDILQEQKQICGVTDTENITGNINLGATSAGNIVGFELSQFGSVKQQCVMDGMITQQMKNTSSGESKAAGWDPFASMGLMAIAGIIGVVVLMMFMGGGKGSPSAPPFAPYYPPSAPPSYDSVKYDNYSAPRGGGGGGGSTILWIVGGLFIVLIVGSVVAYNIVNSALEDAPTLPPTEPNPIFDPKPELEAEPVKAKGVSEPVEPEQVQEETFMYS